MKRSIGVLIAITVVALVTVLYFIKSNHQEHTGPNDPAVGPSTEAPVNKLIGTANMLPVPSKLPPLNKVNPSQYRYRLLVDDAELYFNTISCIDTSVKTARQIYGPDKTFDSWDLTAVNKNKYVILIKDGYASGEFLNWAKQTKEGMIDKGNAVLVLKDKNGNEQKWLFRDAFPIKWTGPELKADGSSVTLETIELNHDGLDRLDDGNNQSGNGESPDTGYAYKLEIGSSAFDIGSISFVDRSGKEIYNAGNFGNNLGSIDQNLYKIILRGISGKTGDKLYNWLRPSVSADTARKNIAIVAVDRKGIEMARWNITQAWPVKFDLPDFNAKGNDVEIETLEIVHEGIDRVDDDNDDDD